MRFAASLLPVLAAALLVGVPAAQAQTAEKPRQNAATPAKSQSKAKAGSTQAQAQVQARQATPTSAKPKVEDVSTMRTTPAAGKKDGGGCMHGDASDA